MNRPSILLYEHLAQEIERELAKHATITVASSTDEREILRHVENADAIIIRAKGRVTRAVIAAGKRLRVVGRHGIGVDHIDLNAARDHDVVVVNTPDANTQAVAEFAVGLMLAVSRMIKPGDDLVRRQLPWRNADQLRGFNLKNKTLGLVGLGRVGKSVARICHLGFQMRVIYYDYKQRNIRIDGLPDGESLPLSELFSLSDVVSIHVPLLPSTNALVSGDLLSRMRPGSVLINTSRGPIVDEEALIEMLRNGKIGGAGLDVMSTEPLTDSPLQELSNVILTPHMASYTSESFTMMGTQVVEDVLSVLNGKTPSHAVTAG